jgi:hypothetical protein
MGIWAKPRLKCCLLALERGLLDHGDVAMEHYGSARNIWSWKQKHHGVSCVVVLTENPARNSPGTSETARTKMPIKKDPFYNQN